MGQNSLSTQRPPLKPNVACHANHQETDEHEDWQRQPPSHQLRYIAKRNRSWHIFLLPCQIMRRVGEFVRGAKIWLKVNKESSLSYILYGREFALKTVT